MAQNDTTFKLYETLSLKIKEECELLIEARERNTTRVSRSQYFEDQKTLMELRKFRNEISSCYRIISANREKSDSNDLIMTSLYAIYNLGISIELEKMESNINELKHKLDNPNTSECYKTLARKAIPEQEKLFAEKKNLVIKNMPSVATREEFENMMDELHRLSEKSCFF